MPSIISIQLLKDPRWAWHTGHLWMVLYMLSNTKGIQQHRTPVKKHKMQAQMYASSFRDFSVVVTTVCRHWWHLTWTGWSPNTGTIVLDETVVVVVVAVEPGWTTTVGWGAILLSLASSRSAVACGSCIASAQEGGRPGFGAQYPFCSEAISRWSLLWKTVNTTT